MSPFFVTIQGIEPELRQEVNKEEFTMGRSIDADIQLNDYHISRIHILVTKKGDHVFIEDKNSSNGTFVNENIIPAGSAVQIHLDDKIRLGKSDYIIRIELKAEPKAIPVAIPIPDQNPEAVFLSEAMFSKEPSPLAVDIVLSEAKKKAAQIVLEAEVLAEKKAQAIHQKAREINQNAEQTYHKKMAEVRKDSDEILANSERQGQELVREARKKAQVLREEIDHYIQTLRDKSQQEADEITSRARASAEKIRSEALITAQKIDEDATLEAQEFTAEARRGAHKITTESYADVQKIVADANLEAQKVISEASESAKKLLVDANKEAEKTKSEARNEAQKMKTEAAIDAEKSLMVASKSSENLIQNAKQSAESIKADAFVIGKQRASDDAEEMLRSAKDESEALRRTVKEEADLVLVSAKEESQRMILSTQSDTESLRRKVQDESDALRKIAREETESLRKLAREETEALRRFVKDETEELRKSARDEVDGLRFSAQQDSEALLKKAKAESELLQRLAQEETESLRNSTYDESERLLKLAIQDSEEKLNAANTESARVLKALKNEAERIQELIDTGSKKLSKNTMDLEESNSAFQRNLKLHEDLDAKNSVLIEKVKTEELRIKGILTEEEAKVIVLRKAQQEFLSQKKMLEEEVLILEARQGELSAQNYDLEQQNSQIIKAFEAQKAVLEEKIEKEKSLLSEKSELSIEELRLSFVRLQQKMEQDILDDLFVKKVFLVKDIHGAIQNEVVRLVEASQWNKISLAMEGHITQVIEGHVSSLSQSMANPLKPLDLLKKRRQEKNSTFILGCALGALALFGGQRIYEIVAKDVNPMQTAVLKESKSRQEELQKRRFNPAQVDEIKETYVDSVIYTKNYAEIYLNQDYQARLYKAMSQYLLKTWRIDEDKSLAVLSSGNALVKALVDHKAKIHPDFVSEGLNKMHQLEDETLNRMKINLGSEVRLDSFRRFESNFFKEETDRRSSAQ